MNARLIGTAVIAALVAVGCGKKDGSGDADKADAKPSASVEKATEPNHVEEILALAKKSAEEDSNVNFYGFFPGMSRYDAADLAAHYKLKEDEYMVNARPGMAVWRLWFSLQGVRRITRAGSTVEELAQAVANSVGDLKGSNGGWEHKTIDGIVVTFSNGGLIIRYDKVALQEPIVTSENVQREMNAQRECVQSIIRNMVTIPGKSFKIGKYEVTQTQWYAVMGDYPSHFFGDDNPVECVSWKDCKKFLEKLNAIPEVKSSGLTFRLPTVAEWEYACRAGSTGDYCRLADGTEITKDTLGKVAWYKDNSEKKTHPVGRKEPNAFGLYDMHGNVLEWCEDLFYLHGERDPYHMNWGGSWDSNASWCSAGQRHDDTTGPSCDRYGFRLAASQGVNQSSAAEETRQKAENRGTKETSATTDVLPVATLPQAVTNENTQVATNNLVASVQVAEEQKGETERVKGLEQIARENAEQKLKEDAEVESVEKSFLEVSKSYFPSLEWNAAARALKKIGRSIQTDRGKKALANHLQAIECLAEICQCLATESKGLTFKDGTVVEDSNEALFRLCQYGYGNGRRIKVKTTIHEWKDFLGGKDSVGLLNQMLNKLVLERCDNIERAMAGKRLLGSALVLKYFYPSVAGCERFTSQLWEKAKRLQNSNDTEIWEVFFPEQVKVSVTESLGGDSLNDGSTQARRAPTKPPSSFCGHRFGEKYLPKRMTREMWQEGEIAVKPVQASYRQFRRLELGYAIDGKQLCMMRLYAHVSREAIEKEFQATKLDLERRFNMTMDSQGHGNASRSSTDGVCFEDSRYRIRLWMGAGTKFGIWLEIIDKQLHPSTR